MNELGQLIGTPYVRAGREIATGVDCWGLVLHVYQAFLSIDLPRLPGFDTEDAALVARRLTQEEVSGKEWSRQREPLHLDLVAMARNRFFHHVGLWDAINKQVIHAVPAFGIVGHNLSTLRVRGFRRIEFYRFNAHGNNRPDCKPL